MCATAVLGDGGTLLDTMGRGAESCLRKRASPTSRTDRHPGERKPQLGLSRAQPQQQDSRNLRPDGPSGEPLALFESGEILLYLADKTGQFISTDPNTRYETIRWVMWQMGGVGPMFGQVGFFNKSARQSYEDKRPRDRYAIESAQLLGVLDERLGGCDRVTGADYGIADISCGVGCAT
jgi:hypothetical protein